MYMEKIDVTALGELLIDFTENGVSEQGNLLFEANPGGAPCNVLAMLTKLGHKTAFIGKVGNDFLGKRLKTAIEEVGILSDFLYMDNKVHTTLAMVHNFPDGDREFSFYRNPGADMMLTEDEVSKELIQNSKIFHFGTLSMTHKQVRQATKKAVSIAKEAKNIISFDPNLRLSLWEDLNEVKEQMIYGLENCNILKISDNEIQWFTGRTDYTECVNVINNKYHIPFILLSLGKQGSRAYYQGKMVEADSFLRKDTIDTTGAGDTFCACILHYILKYGLEDLNENILREMLVFSNCAASFITTKKGALKVMPSKEEIEHIVLSYNR